MSIAIQILGAGKTSQVRARRYVRNGRAVWADTAQTSIRFVTGTKAGDKIHAAELTRLHEQFDRARNYDRINRPMTLKEMAAIPIVNPMALMIEGSGRTRAHAPRLARPRVIVENGKPAA